MWIASSFDQVRTPILAALGNFDGVHQGHVQVIAPMLPGADRPPKLGSSLAAAPHSTVVTFSPHPQEFFSGQPKALLTPIPEKAQQLASLGVQQLVLLPFNRELATLSPTQFVEEILLQKLQAQGLSVGQDFCFGSRRSGSAQDLQTIAARHQIPVNITPLEIWQGERISSSAIRHALLQGDLHRANALLGRPYGIQGQVVRGQQLGRTLGFPTANLQLPPHKFVPRQGVYGVWVHNLDRPWSQPRPGVMNIGTRPTIAGQDQTLEVHILGERGGRSPSDLDPSVLSSSALNPSALNPSALDPSALDPLALDLYGQVLRVDLVQFLRSEQTFASLEALKDQIAQDCAIASQILGRGVSDLPKT
ncbi:bifunctional riboflavin kinase/FAD synthetase [Prochlorothrix hollandica]|uniref:Riboflavin biosynthesis protein n=1 Tax=Prochlorothrix hollandica PCC 9006 = CALU 1027 TaxID=317619 RepID=A0A0M2PS94_PROHO|nr:bifunctional riboflavin kinase/FAD synthetase [Prochlorothrix hollandica]KKI98032.1 riboflavin kinase [Prochlorothrix hollandica PCC 9006 = CALU 1027]